MKYWLSGRPTRALVRSHMGTHSRARRVSTALWASCQWSDKQEDWHPDVLRVYPHVLVSESGLFLTPESPPDLLQPQRPSATDNVFVPTQALSLSLYI